MTGIVSDAKKFFIEHSMTAELKANADSWVIRSSLLKRGNFVSTTLKSFNLVIQNVALTIFYTLASIVTLGLKPNYKASLCKNVKEGIVHTNTFFLSILGVINPKIINQNFLQFKPFEIEKKIDANQKVLRDLVDIVGSITLRLA